VSHLGPRPDTYGCHRPSLLELGEVISVQDIGAFGSLEADSRVSDFPRLDFKFLIEIIS